MQQQASRSVIISENGRSGEIHYRGPDGSQTFYWEFGGGDVVVIIQVHDRRAWHAPGKRTASERSGILCFVADEVLRQKASGCVAEMDEEGGRIELRRRSPDGLRRSIDVPGKDIAWYYRLRDLKLKLALVVTAIALSFAGMVWLKNKLLTIDPGKGVPLGLCVRTGTHIATLIQTLEAYTPSLHRDGSKDRFTVSIFLVPLDGSAPKMIPIVHDRTFSSFQLAKVLGSDGRTLWYDVNGIGGVDLKTYELLDPSGVRDPCVPQPASPFAPSVGQYMSAGFLTGAGSWLGLHSAAELEREFDVKKFVRRVVPQEDAKQIRRFYRAELDAPVEDKYHRILSMTPINEAGYLNAAFLRLDDRSEPLRLAQPDGALMTFTAEPGLNGKLMVARVDTAGNILWKVDTGIHRFKLQQILPGKESFAFVGTRPPIPDKVSEPLLVIVDNRSGAVVSTSLWQ